MDLDTRYREPGRTVDGRETRSILLTGSDTPYRPLISTWTQAWAGGCSRSRALRSTRGVNATSTRRSETRKKDPRCRGRRPGRTSQRCSSTFPGSFLIHHQSQSSCSTWTRSIVTFPFTGTVSGSSLNLMRPSASRLLPAGSTLSSDCLSSSQIDRP
jgi:hypothetical protein